jgi:hypothetical protein
LALQILQRAGNEKWLWDRWEKKEASINQEPCHTRQMATLAGNLVKSADGKGKSSHNDSVYAGQIASLWVKMTLDMWHRTQMRS